jgi:hypothetical protein
MDVALIAPVALLRYTETQNIQMMLPSVREPDYLAHYRKLSLKEFPNYYVILDNGAWEREPLDNGDLIGLGWRTQVQEVVTPDVINDKDATVKAMRKFFKRYQRFAEITTSWRPSFVAVAHGYNAYEAMEFIRLVEDEFPQVDTISAGRAFTRACGDNKARLKLAEWVMERYPGRFWFHLLGYNDAWHGELKACRGLVRSVDTVAPFTAAYHGMKLHDVNEFNGPRPAGYFNTPPGRFDIQLVEDNIKRLLGEVHD